jgi:hypothetical protein
MLQSLVKSKTIVDGKSTSLENVAAKRLKTWNVDKGLNTGGADVFFQFGFGIYSFL